MNSIFCRFVEYIFLSFFLCLNLAGGLRAQNASFPQSGGAPALQLTRYVDGQNGAFNNDGLSWETAKNLLQETINSLHDYMVKHKVTKGGRIFVKAGTYVPIASTESEGGNVLNTSFIMYEGITVYGGFAGGETSPEERARRKHPDAPAKNTPHGWELAHKTILSGNHSENDGTTFIWDPDKQKYEMTFPGNSYHVVWFASNGFDEKGRAKPLKEEACIDGCTLTGGNASFGSMTETYHTAFGGGAYMVKNSVLRNCIIKKNYASRRGGGVYMDGGGLVEGCYIHTNQTLGVGGTEGYGGGVSIDDDGKVTHSPIVNNVARIGGGVALNYNGPMEVNGSLPVATLLPAATSCLIANNTATQEAGGIFFNHGGAVNHLTVVRNRCNGPDITVRGIRYGRSSGAYIWESGQIYNSIFWGGRVDANRNIQMAIHNTSGKAGRVRINYSAFENHDITDWTGTIKNTVANLEHKNAPDPNDLLSNYMAFRAPTEVAGVWAVGDGVTADYDYLAQEVTVGNKVKWIPAANSAARDKSVQLLDVHGKGEYQHLKHVDVNTDIHGVPFEPNDEAGAFITDKVNILPADIGGIKTLFIDPSHRTLSAETVGYNWTHPLNNLNEALAYFRENNLSGQILIKEGTLNTLGEYYNIHQRSSYIKMVSNVTVKGGYSKKLTGTEVGVRNPQKYVTRITADLAEDDYAYNSCHIITFDNVSNAVVDGLHISYANALSSALFEDMSKEGRPQFQHGGGIICWNTKLGPQNGYVSQNMTGNKVRNCVISNNSALRGSAVFLHAAAGTEVNLEMENCIIHNNASAVGKQKDGITDDSYSFSTIYVGADAAATGASLTMDHCDILKNVGRPLLTEGILTQVKMTNSVVWANADCKFVVSDSLALTDYQKHILKFNPDSVNVMSSSSHCLFDFGTKIHTNFNQASTKATLGKLEFINPTKNVGVTSVGDATQYGGIPDFTPLNMSPLVNAANDAMSDTTKVGTDFTTVDKRYRGGAADIGALENILLPKVGDVYYVRTDGDDNNGHDGLSWATAFRTLKHALEIAGKAVKEPDLDDNKNIEVWMSGGEYVEVPVDEYGLQLPKKVNVLGGFAKTGNPGKNPNERDISNKNPDFQTIITRKKDPKTGHAEGRVFRGAGKFIIQEGESNPHVIYEGLTIRGGYTTLHNYGAGVFLVHNNEMRNCLIEENIYEPKSNESMEMGRIILGGGGVYANRGSVIKNCIIRNNEVKFKGQFGEWKEKWFWEGGGWKWEPSSFQEEKPIFCGGGVFLEDATIINSLVVDNKVTLEQNLDHKQYQIVDPTFPIQGAGVYISIASKVFNCTIANNAGDNLKKAVAYGGVYESTSTSGSSFYNCIFWGNYGNGQTNENFYQVGPSTFDYKNLYNCYYSTYNGDPADPNLAPENAYICFEGSNFDQNNWMGFSRECKSHAPFYVGVPKHDDYSLMTELTSNSQYCINRGDDKAADILRDTHGIVVDITGAPRVQDCQIDKGAYEYDGTYAIQPNAEGNQLIFYVNQNGKGTSSGDSKENAACADKVQLILDAAGRQRADEKNKDKEIVVRLAGNSAGIVYCPHRSFEENIYGEDPRTWSLLVPRGVTVEGGWDENFNQRNAAENKTILKGEYNSTDLLVSVYHVVHFTEYIYDEAGYIKRDQNSLNDPKDPILLPSNIAQKSILDGVYIENGAANGDAAIHQWGGAAIVPDFAHIRNCILRNNQAATAGGALFLRPKALVSGCLFENNRSNKGGAIAVQDVAKTDDMETQKESPETRARIYTSTFVNNEAVKAGGAISYLNNVRVSSSVFWKNRANTESNIDGKYEDTQHKYEEEDYPFAYCAVENVRMPGINNVSVATDNDAGTRFDKISDLATPDYSYYGLTDFSVLLRTGMPITQYEKLVVSKQLTPLDFMQTARYGQVGEVNLNENVNIDMGARSLGKLSILKPDSGKVLRRIYVTHPEKVDMRLVGKVLDYRKTPEGQSSVNAQQGASFAFPMQSLNDALRYVISARKDASLGYSEKAYFEIFISGGTFYPEADLDGKIGISRDNTFLVPEGVAIFGAMYPYLKGNQGYLCQNTPDLKPEQNDAYGKIAPELTALSVNTLDIIGERQLYDLNANDIFEPWEFANQTTLSGKVINKDQVNNVYHVVSVLSDPGFVGWMGKGVNKDEKGVEIAPSIVRLDGLQITEGQAWHDDANPNIMDYTGGGILANGIYGEKLGNSGDKPTFGDYKYRPIRLKISHCRFIGNKAGLGGAIMNNVPADISSCSFEQNEVMSQAVAAPESPNRNPLGIDIKGLGSAIYTTNHVQLINCLFANNEAKDSVTVKPLYKNPLQGYYGAGTIASFHLDLGTKEKLKSITGRVSMLNCNIVNNKAQKYPAVFTQSPNNATTAEKPDHNNMSLMNSIFWGNRSVDGEKFPHFNHVINFDKESDLSQANEALWFCAYEEGLGKQPKAGRDMRGEEIPYSTSLPRKFQSADTPEGRRDCYNYNIYLNTDNSSLDGPNFTNPSLGVGVDNFLPTANWLPYRQNNLTDNGWTYLQQKITNDGTNFICQFVDEKGNPIDAANPKYHGGGAYLSFYNLLKEGNGSAGYEKGSRYGNIGVPIGNEVYMRNKLFVAENPDTYEASKMLRISLDPNPSHQQTYIDIGLYEYQHVQLKPEVGKDVDLLWVSEKEKPDNGIADGRTWKTPTSDLQRAIETLLASRNGHRKEIRIMEGTYHPVYSFKENVNGEDIDRLAFRIHTSDLNDAVILSDPQMKAGVKSLSLTGGWSASISGARDIEAYPTYLRSPLREGVEEHNLKYLFDISDVQQYYGRKYLSERAIAQGVVIPLVFDGLTFVNTIRKKQTSPDGGGAAINYREQILTPVEGATVPDEPRLSVKNCIFMNSGLDEKMATVHVGNVGRGGKKSLFYNTLFHSNLGSSLVAAQKADVINCTFAMNGGNLRLSDASSILYGNVFWCNNWPSDDGSLKEFEVAEGTTLVNNAYTGATELLSDNYALSKDNHDIFAGPNFVDPENLDVEQRDFHLQPSVRLLNQCEPTDYPGGVLAKDLADKPRLFGEKVDLGAYEYQYELQRVVYVDPLRVNPSGDGKSWGEAFNKEDMQRAIDLAAVYAAGHKQPEEQAYVYMKVRNDRVNTNAKLTLREGVSVYGGIARDFMQVVDEKADHPYEKYERLVRDTRPGMVNALRQNTLIAEVDTKGKYGRLALLDGFEVAYNENQPQDANIPAVCLKSEESKGTVPVAMRNSIIHGFHKVKAPVIQIDNGLLYNTLVRNNLVENETHPIVEMGTSGWAVNNTLVSKTGNHIVAPILNDQQLHNVVTKMDDPNFAPYFRATSELPSSFTNNLNLNYQLGERSQHLDQVKSDLPALFISGELKGLMDYNTDRDLLGNPRKLATGVDNGCYETWNSWNANLSVNTLTDAAHYAGQHYPHEGSVVYATAHPIEVDPQFDLAKVPVMRPGYFLLQEGGGWYGHGKANLELSYAAVERDLGADNLVALPFDYDYEARKSAAVSYRNGALTLNPVGKAEVASYNRNTRALSIYRYEHRDSPSWEPKSGEVPANVGVYYGLGSSGEVQTHRFTSWNMDGSPVYVEDAALKTVTLHQANTTELNGSKPNFTAIENMGWNLVGQPYMVSSYATGETKASLGDYGMNVPHLIYLMRENGGYQTMKSWNEDSQVGVGNAFFTQTAVIKDKKENITFNIPRLLVKENKEGKNRVRLSSAMGSDDIFVIPSAEVADLTYHYGVDGVKWMAMNERLPQLYLTNLQGSRFSLASSVPFATELNLGVWAPKEGAYTFGLPDGADFVDFNHVWLTDREERIVTDLKEEDYVVALASALDTQERFTLKFGGAAPILDDVSDCGKYTVFIRKGLLHVRNLDGGEQIRVYDMMGRDVLSEEATAHEFTAPLSLGVYIVKVNGNVYKVR